MKILKAKDANSIRFLNLKIQEYIGKEEIKEYDKKSFIKWLRMMISSPLLGVWVCVEENEEPETEEKVSGYIIVMIQQSLNSEHVNIIQLFGDTEEIENELLSHATNWTKNNGITEIKTITLHPKKWKDIGFEVKEHLVTKEV
jgi:hypothetical protein